MLRDRMRVIMAGRINRERIQSQYVESPEIFGRLHGFLNALNFPVRLLDGSSCRWAWLSVAWLFGRLSVVSRLLASAPHRFATVVPATTWAAIRASL